MLRFSLILATVGRTEEVEHFLKHLDRQTYRNFELIIVDQNPDDRLVPIIKAYKSRFPVLHLHSQKGVSRARNVGLKYISGDIVAFPDDDCWYPNNLLERVENFFAKNPEWSGLSGRTVGLDGYSSVGRWDKRVGPIDRYNEWVRSCESAIFVKKRVIERIGGFDEELGPGAGTPWGANEGDDFILRALKVGFHFYYDPDLIIFHPHPIQQYDAKALERARLYGYGMGHVLRKHKYPLWFVVYYWLRPLIGVLLALTRGNTGKARYYWASLNGRIFGWKEYK